MSLSPEPEIPVGQDEDKQTRSFAVRTADLLVGALPILEKLLQKEPEFVVQVSPFYLFAIQYLASDEKLHDETVTPEAFQQALSIFRGFIHITTLAALTTQDLHPSTRVSDYPTEAITRTSTARMVPEDID